MLSQKHHEAVVQAAGRHLLQTNDVATGAAAADNTTIYVANNKTTEGCMIYATGVVINGGSYDGKDMECKTGANGTM